MAEPPHSYEALIRRLSAEPVMAGLAKPGAGILVWEDGGERLAWTSRAAAAFGSSLAGASGRTLLSLQGRDRLKALATGLAPREGTRLERLRIDPDRLAPPVTCACRLASLDGREVLVTLIVGSIPKVSSRPQSEPSAAEASPIPATASPDAPAPTEPPRLAEREAGRPLRFVWRMDAGFRFTDASRELAEAVGPAASAIIGRSWHEVANGWVEDPQGAILECLTQGRTWSGQTVFWGIGDSQEEVPVDLAGMPVRDSDQNLTGFRGFGLIRLDAKRPREPVLSPEASRAAGPSADPSDVAPDETPDGEAANPDANWFEELRGRVAASLNQQADQGASVAQAASTAPADGAADPGEPPSRLSSAERNAFREIARALGARMDTEAVPAVERVEPAPEAMAETPPVPTSSAPMRAAMDVLDGLPSGVLIHRDERILYANRFLLDLTGYGDVDGLAREGGVAALFKGSPALVSGENVSAPVVLTDRRHEGIAAEVRLSSVMWDGVPATFMLIRSIPDPEAPRMLRASELDLRGQAARILELEAILDTATDGVIALDETGRILSLNRSAEALFGYDQREVVGDAITVLLAPESHIVALDYLESLRSPGVASLLNDGREVLGRVRQGGTIALFMTMGSVNEGPNRKFCAVLRDMTAFKKAEGELLGAKRAAEEASSQKSDLLAKISHEIRTPLNAIIGFAEVMLEERFGPIGNERYKEYLKDVHASGAHVMSLVNDLLDLAKIEAGRMDLSFTSVDLNALASACFTLMQPQAMRQRIVMRTSFAPKLPPVVADERSIRQILLNLVSNAVKFTDAGGQVILSTALTDRGEVAFRVRDTGIGMTDKEIESALEPFRQIATAHRRGGTGLGLPLTKALVEANRGALQIASHPSEGTLVEVIFPPTRVLAE